MLLPLPTLEYKFPTYESYATYHATEDEEGSRSTHESKTWHRQVEGKRAKTGLLELQFVATNQIGSERLDKSPPKYVATWLSQVGMNSQNQRHRDGLLVHVVGRQLENVFWGNESSHIWLNLLGSRKAWPHRLVSRIRLRWASTAQRSLKAKMIPIFCQPQAMQTANIPRRTLRGMGGWCVTGSRFSQVLIKLHAWLSWGRSHPYCWTRLFKVSAASRRLRPCEYSKLMYSASHSLKWLGKLRASVSKSHCGTSWLNHSVKSDSSLRRKWRVFWVTHPRCNRFTFRFPLWETRAPKTASSLQQKTLRLQEAHFWEASLGSRFLAQKLASQIGFQDFKKLLLEAQEAASWSFQEACFFGFQNWLLELASWNYKHI